MPPKRQTAPVAAATVDAVEVVDVIEAPAPVDPVEQLAREVCKTQGRNPDDLVSYTIPEQFGTPEGNVYYTRQADMTPMWQAYASVARATLKLKTV